jgi:hypothetical protein
MTPFIFFSAPTGTRSITTDFPHGTNGFSDSIDPMGPLFARPIGWFTSEPLPHQTALKNALLDEIGM